IEGLERLLQRIESGDVAIVARDLPAPSPLAMEILNARPYAYLDDAPLEERRTQAVMGRRWADEATPGALGKLDAAAIDRVRAEAWPDASSADELHDSLLGLGFIAADEVGKSAEWPTLLATLAQAQRATRLTLSWVAAERLPQFDALHPAAVRDPAIDAPAEFAERSWDANEALVELLRSRLQGLGPVTAQRLADSLAWPVAGVERALAQLAAEGVVMAGAYSGDAGGE